MKCAFLLLFGSLSLAAVSAQERIPVTFKAFPSDYEVFWGGSRLPYNLREDGLRTYLLSPGPLRVSLVAPGELPLGLNLTVKSGMPWVEAKLEPRQGALSFVDEAATGKLPRSVAFSSDGKQLFVALQGEPGVDVYEVPSLKKTQRLATAEGYQGGFSDVLTIGNEVWAVQNDGRARIFDAKTLAAKDSRTLSGGGNTFLTDLGGGKLVVDSWDAGQLLAVDSTSGKPIASFSMNGSVRGFAFGQGMGFATLFDRGQVAVLDGSTWKLKAVWNVGKAPRPVAVLKSTLFVGDMGSAQVNLFDTATGKSLGSVAVASNPHVMDASADQSMVAVVSRGRNNPSDYQLEGPEFGKVTLLNTQGQVLASVWGRNQPTGVAFSPDGRFLAFTDYLDNNVELYRIRR